MCNYFAANPGPANSLLPTGALNQETQQLEAGEPDRLKVMDEILKNFQILEDDKVFFNCSENLCRNKIILVRTLDRCVIFNNCEEYFKISEGYLESRGFLGKAYIHLTHQTGRIQNILRTEKAGQIEQLQNEIFMNVENIFRNEKYGLVCDSDKLNIYDKSLHSVLKVQTQIEKRDCCPACGNFVKCNKKKIEQHINSERCRPALYHQCSFVHIDGKVCGSTLRSHIVVHEKSEGLSLSDISTPTNASPPVESAAEICSAGRMQSASARPTQLADLKSFPECFDLERKSIIFCNDYKKVIKQLTLKYGQSFRLIGIRCFCANIRLQCTCDKHFQKLLDITGRLSANKAAFKKKFISDQRYILVQLIIWKAVPKEFNFSTFFKECRSLTDYDFRVPLIILENALNIDWMLKLESEQKVGYTKDHQLSTLTFHLRKCHYIYDES